MSEFTAKVQKENRDKHNGGYASDDTVHLGIESGGSTE